MQYARALFIEEDPAKRHHLFIVAGCKISDTCREELGAEEVIASSTGINLPDTIS
jgi:hypothetical protein